MPEFPADYRRMTPLGMAAFETVKCVRDWAVATDPRDPITYFIDKFDDREDVAYFMNTIKSSPNRAAEFRMHDWHWASTARCVPLQAADVLAYEAQKEWVNYYVEGGLVEARKSLRA